MPRILAFDVGKKRTGMAHTDDMKIIASGYGTFATGEIIKEVQNYIEKHDVDTFVVGMPVDLLDRETNGTEFAKAVIKKLRNHFPDIPIVEEDERFTSQMAMQTLIASGVKKKKRREKGLLDEVSATIILQSYLGNI